ncbi:unnamed protein product [Symbiodinium sp. CCMP2592]|nr:unnamed protein product [Symbiodinium sp. CCMP2592]
MKLRAQDHASRSGASVYAGIPPLPLKRSNVPPAAPATREKKDTREESARSSLRSSVSSFVAESIGEIGMEPVARDTSYGRALNAEMAPPTVKQTSAEAAQAGSWPAAEPVTREKKDTREESARSSLRSSVSSFVAESIGEIGMEPVARDTSYGRVLSAEMVPPTVKQTSAEAAQAGSWPAAEPVTREKKDTREGSARSSRRSSVSSFEAGSIEEISMEPVARDTSYGRALSAEMAPPTVKQTSAEAAQAGSWPAAEPVTREKKDTREESARSSRRSSVTSFVAESIEEIGMEPMARDTSYGRVLSAEMAPPTVKQSSAEAAQAGSCPAAEPVTREKDTREESARSSLRSSVSSFAAESIEEISMEPVARDISYGRVLSAEMAPPTVKQTSAEAAQAGSWPAAEPVTREKKDTREESARSSRRSSVSSFEAGSIEEISMEPVARDTSCGRVLSAEMALPTANQNSAEAAQVGSWPATEPVSSSFGAGSIDEISMEPVARDTSYGRALSTGMAPPTVKQTSAEAAQAGSCQAAEPVTREKKDAREESARSSRRSSVSSSVAESIEEIGLESVPHQGYQSLMAREHLTRCGGSQEPRVLSGVFADDLEEISVEPVFATETVAQTQHHPSFSDRTLGAEIGPATIQGSAEARASSLARAAPATMGKKDEKEGAAMISQRSSASSSVADAAEEISMEPEPRTNRMASDLLESRQAETNGPLFVMQASGASTLESVDAGLNRSQQGRADGGGTSSRQEALTGRSCSHSSSGASSTDMKCPEPEPAPQKQDACLQYVIVFQTSAAPGGCPSLGKPSVNDADPQSVPLGPVSGADLWQDLVWHQALDNAQC